MRELTEHKTNAANDALTVRAVDAPGSGGAHHRYEVTGFTTANPSDPMGQQHQTDLILFQNGPIPESGINGVTQEILLAIVIDRLRAFQAGPFANGYNEAALDYVEKGLQMLKNRTLDRLARGVEGKHAA